MPMLQIPAGHRRWGGLAWFRALPILRLKSAVVACSWQPSEGSDSQPGAKAFSEAATPFVPDGGRHLATRKKILKYGT